MSDVIKIHARYNHTLREAKGRALKDSLTDLMNQFPYRSTVEEIASGRRYTVDSHDARDDVGYLELYILTEQLGPPLPAHTLRVVEQ